MAKKKETLTIEEKLQNALVPDWEQPYKLPENWCWTRLDNVALYKKGPFGSSITKAMFVPKAENTYKVYEQGNAIRKDKNYGSYYITEEKYNELKGFRIFDRDIIVSCAGTIGETYQILQPFEEGIINQALMRIKLFDQINQNYYLYYFDESIQGDIKSKAKGTAIKNIPPFAVLKNLTFPLPPLTEQKRIVDRIESLFSKLDEAKELAENALDSFENRKSAILHKAFTGELTKKWREENGVSFDSWEETTLGKYADTKYGYTESANSEKVGPKFLRITDIQDSKVDWIDVPYCPISEKDFEKYSLNIGDIVIARTGATTGKSYMIADEVEAVFASYLIRVNIFDSKKLQADYLYKFLQSSLYWNQITDLSSGIAQPGVNANKLKQILLPIPSEKEQQEIVRILDSIFAKETEAKELVSVIDKIDLIKKSILSKAFRGELGTNDVNEENSIELLKDILEGQ